ncbi:MAG: dTDP-4-amino-4,6-dideoxygalactose transaminase [Bacteroidota bacterium]
MNQAIPFHQPTVVGTEIDCLKDFLSGTSGHLGKKAEKQLQGLTAASQVLLTTSCTHALEMCALLLDIQPGDEVIMPSFTFVSAANAFVLRGAKIVFVDIEPDTMNIDPACVQAAISGRTKAVLIMHYGGMACDMAALKAVTAQAEIALIEDAAHCIDAYYENQHLGTFGDLGTLSFHYTKNVQCSEGGALLINNERYLERALMLRDKGTNRQAFLDGQVDRYSWVDVGSSYTLGEINAAMLSTQLEQVQRITSRRQVLWSRYFEVLPTATPPECLPILGAKVRANAHLFPWHCREVAERKALQRHLRQQNIQAYFHYVPLHSSPAGQKFGVFHGEDRHTTKRSGALLRLPLFTDMTTDQVDTVVRCISYFYAKR